MSFWHSVKVPEFWQVKITVWICSKFSEFMIKKHTTSWYGLLFWRWQTHESTATSRQHSTSYQFSLCVFICKRNTVSHWDLLAEVKNNSCNHSVPPIASIIINSSEKGKQNIDIRSRWEHQVLIMKKDRPSVRFYSLESCGGRAAGVSCSQPLTSMIYLYICVHPLATPGTPHKGQA